MGWETGQEHHRMGPNETASRLSRLETRWEELERGHKAGGDEAQRALRELVRRYYGAAYRYLLATVRSAEVAEELTQDFAVRFLRGDFKNADPGKGRFRDFLKASLRNLARKRWDEDNRQRDRGPQPLPQGAEVAGRGGDPAEEGPEFLQAWREELLAQAWQALARTEQESGVPCYTVLRLKTDQPDLHSARLAEVVAAHLGKPMTEAGVRQAVKRARARFGELLVEEVARSLGRPSLDELEQELLDLGLLVYCRPSLEKRRADG
jgi:RNA polymerase sigma-70 factor (ECF subfamily)